jgi:hypothetical protein
LGDLPQSARRFFSIQGQSAESGASNRQTQILVGKVGLAACLCLALLYLIFTSGILGGGGVSPASGPSASGSGALPSASSIAAASPAPLCSTNPAATATPLPSTNPPLSVGDPCSYLSGLVVNYPSALNPTTPAANSGATLVANLLAIDGGGLLPTTGNQQIVTSDQAGAFSFAPGAGTAWRIFFSVPSTVNPGQKVSYPVTVVQTGFSGDYGPGWAPPCTASSAQGQDATFHFGPDARLVLVVSVCPDNVILANAVSQSIPRIAVVNPTPVTYYNPVSVMLNYSSQLRYARVAAAALRVQETGAGVGTDILLPLALLLITAVWGAAAYWVHRRMYNLDRIPEAHYVEEEAPAQAADDLCVGLANT